MKKIFYFLALFFISIPLLSQTNKHIVFIGDYTPNFKDSVSSILNSDIYRGLLEDHPPYFSPQTPCDEINDTISGCDWNNIPWSDSVALVTLPNFPGCHVLVYYRVRICPNNSLIRQIDIDRFVLIEPSLGDCDSLFNYLESGTEEEIALKLGYIEENLFYEVGYHEMLQSSEIPLCDSLEYLQYVFYTEVACKAKIKITIEYNSVIFFIYENITCNIDGGCCKTFIECCQDSLGNIYPDINREQMGTPCDRMPIEPEYQYLIDYYNALHPEAVHVYPQPYPCTATCP